MCGWVAWSSPDTWRCTLGFIHVGLWYLDLGGIRRRRRRRKRREWRSRKTRKGTRIRIKVDGKECGLPVRFLSRLL